MTEFIEPDGSMLTRRRLIRTLAGAAAALPLVARSRIVIAEVQPSPEPLPEPAPGEAVFEYIERLHGQFNQAGYFRLLGAANEFKEGDAIVGVAAADDPSRTRARLLLARTTLREIDAHPLLNDELTAFLTASLDAVAHAETGSWTLGRLREFLLTEDERAIRPLMPGLSSEVIGCVVKLMSNADLIAVGQKVFNPLPGTNIGAKGYLGARIQPNSPTDNVDDILWQVLDGWSYATGDVLLGTNPVSSDPDSVMRVESILKDLLATFGVDDELPHCVLAHIDVQAEVESRFPGSTALWFQSIAGSDTANATFDVSVARMRRYAAQRAGRFGMYFETGQGADFTNGHSHGFDMVLHESRKYGFARALTRDIAAAQARAGAPVAPWVHLNDVAGFIGPEVFRTREQLVRCCLEDIVMGKLHGLCLGLDVCSTLHMDVSLDDLDWCLEQIAPANPAYLMALPTKIDPMLGYLTTGYHDHVRLREKFGYRVADGMRRFFEEVGVIDDAGRPTEHFGDPLHLFVQYCRRKGDRRPSLEIREDGQRALQAVQGRGVFVAQGYGASPEMLPSALASEVHRIYEDAKACIWAELPQKFIDAIPDHIELNTRSADRTDYILHPESGERLTDASLALLRDLRRRQAGKVTAQILVSDGLNALSITDDGHLAPFLKKLRTELIAQGFVVAKDHLVLRNGRVRAGYRSGEVLFGGLSGRRALLHIIGERPGSGHHTFSVYMTAPTGDDWGTPGKVDHNITKVVSGIALTALAPEAAAVEAAGILAELS
jgi:ethanolamine ammonia-lyase large subunit